jgi:hypothetical protein
MAKDKFAGPFDFAPISRAIESQCGGAPLRVTGEKVKWFLGRDLPRCTVSRRVLAEKPIDCRIFFA